MTTFEGRDVVQPRVVGQMRMWGDGGFEGLEVKCGKINNVVY